MFACKHMCLSGETVESMAQGHKQSQHQPFGIHFSLPRPALTHPAVKGRAGAITSHSDKSFEIAATQSNKPKACKQI